MPRRCTICDHLEAHAVNVALVQRDTYRTIADRYGLAETSLKRHAKEHLPELLSQAKRATEVAQADSLLMRVEGLYKRTEAILDAAEDDKEWPLALSAIRECRGNLELLGRVTKELETAPTFNLALNPEWIELRTLIVTTLEEFPAAKRAVAEAIRALDEGSNVASS